MQSGGCLDIGDHVTPLIREIVIKIVRNIAESFNIKAVALINECHSTVFTFLRPLLRLIRNVFMDPGLTILDGLDQRLLLVAESLLKLFSLIHAPIVVGICPVMMQYFCSS